MFMEPFSGLDSRGTIFGLFHYILLYVIFRGCNALLKLCPELLAVVYAVNEIVLQRGQHHIVGDSKTIDVLCACFM